MANAKKIMAAAIALSFLVGCGAGPTAPQFPGECDDSGTECSISVTELGDDIPEMD